MRQTVKTSFWFDKEDRMVEKMKDLGLSYSKITKIIGYEQRSTICNIFNGRQPCPEHVLNKLIEMGFSFDDIIIE